MSETSFSVPFRIEFFWLRVIFLRVVNGVHRHCDDHALLDVNPVVSYILVAFTLQSKSSDFNYLIVYNLSIFNFNQILILILGFTWAKVNTSEEFHWPPVQRRGSPRSFRGTHLPEWCKFSYVWEFCFIYTNTDELFNLLDRQVVQLVLHFRIPGQQEANVTIVTFISAVAVVCFSMTLPRDCSRIRRTNEVLFKFKVATLVNVRLTFSAFHVHPDARSCTCIPKLFPVIYTRFSSNLIIFLTSVVFFF